MGDHWEGVSPFHDVERVEGEVTETDEASETGSSEPEAEEQADEEEDRPEDDLNPRALRLTTDERDFMLTFLPLVVRREPSRGSSNTYQLLRVSVDDVEAFLADEEYRSVLILLALMTGTAPLTEPMIAELVIHGRGDLRRLSSSRGEGRRVAADRLRLPGAPTATLTPAVIATWMSKVARYSFHPVEA